jgi:acetoin utilization deacetylase AcuC-like enzyme
MFGGFCYLNNVAVAAQWLTSKGQRVAIIDLDFHHGNGSDVLFCSIHADPHVEFPFYSGLADERGDGAGHGATINYPPPPGTDEGKYLQVLAQALEHIVEFAPDTLLVSSGLDILEGDPLGDLMLTKDTLRQIGRELALLRLPTVIVQEGGYLMEGLGASAVAFLRGFSNHSSTPDVV